MEDLVMIVALAFAAAAAVLAAAVLTIYARLHRRFRVPFTLGLATSAGLLLAANLLLVCSYLWTWAVIPDSLAPLLLGVGLLECGGLGFMFHSASI